MKRLFLGFLLIALLISLCPAAFATEDAAIAAADELNAMGLFTGTGTDEKGRPIYELDRAPTRHEAVTMLVRLLGKEAEAKAGNWDIPFTDVAAWAEPYVGYAYANGLTNGTSTTTFGGNDKVTATQYLTFVLRALGYQSGKDFQWDAAWDLTDRLGITDGEYSSKNNSDFLRGNIVLISRDAMDATVQGKGITLLQNIRNNLGTPSYALSDYTERKLSDAQIKSLKNASLDTLRAEISTIGDAVAWLDQFEAREYDNLNSRAISVSPETYFPLVTSLEAVVPMTYTVLSAWLISDDFDDVQYIISTTTRNGGSFSLPCSALALPAGLGEGFHIFSPHTLSSRVEQNKPINIKTAFQNKKINSFNHLEQELILPWSESRHFQILLVDASQPRVEFSWDQTAHRVSLVEGEARYCYDINDNPELLEQLKVAEREQWLSQAKEIKISDFNLPTAIGETMLSFDAASALVGQDPEVIAEKVKSVADVLQYMIAARFGYNSPNVYTPWFGAGDWGYDLPGEYQLLQNYGCCCAGYANAVSYLLEGDYEKVGTLRWIGGGNHTISWVYTNGKYYVFDFTQYCGGNYKKYNSPVTVLDRLEDYYDQMPNIYPKSEVVIMVAFESFGYPSNWQDPPYFTGLTFPAEAEGKIITIYQKDPEYGVKFEELVTALPGWNAPYGLSDMQGTPLKGGYIEIPDDLPNQKEEPTVPVNAEYKIYYAGTILAETGNGKLSNAQIKALASKTPEEVAATITTYADACEWIYAAGYRTSGMNINGNGGGILFSIANDRGDKELSWTEMTTLINILLKGDYDEVGTLLCAVTSPDKNFPYFYYMSFSYIKKGGWYYIMDPRCMRESKGLPCCRAYTIKLNDLTAVKDILAEINDDFYPITIATYPLYTEEIIMATYDDNPLLVGFDEIPGIRYLFRASAEDGKRYEEEKKLAELEEAAAWKSEAKQIDISRYHIPEAIGKRNLTYDEAATLVGQDPEVIAEKVKSVADVLQYMIAARFGYNSPNVYTPWFGAGDWGYDLPGEYQLLQNYGCCCAGYANAVSYLLEGDYEKVGTLRWIGGGNHTISWVYTNGKYYVFDFTQYCDGGNYNNYYCPVTELDRLEDYYDQMPNRYPKSEVVIMVAFESFGYPSHWQNPPNFTGLTFPTEAEGKIITIYQKDPQKGVLYKDLNVALPGWNAP